MNERKLESIAAANLEAVKLLRERSGHRPFLAVFVPSSPPAYAKFWPVFEAYLPNPLDLRDKFQDKALFFDGVHLSKKGHQRLGEEVFHRLHNLLQ